MSELHAFIGRQAIFDRESRVVAYELLYRDSEHNRAKFDDVNKAAASTMLTAFIEIGLDELVGNAPAFVNLTAEFLLGTLPIPLPPERTVLEVLETVAVTPELIASLGELRARGFTIALDDFVLTEDTRPLLALADIIKLDVLGVAHADIEARYAALRPHVALMLAERIETPEEHAFLLALGFDRFQGYFLEVPRVTKTGRLPHDRTALLRLLSALYDPRLDLRVIEGLVAAEVGLGVRLLKLASTAAVTRGAPIASLQQAIARLGVRQVAALVTLILVSGFDDKPLELARQALIRARMCELLARGQSEAADEMFTAGLLSMLDAMMDRPLASILDQIPLTRRVREALDGGGGNGARIVETAKHQSRGDLRAASDAGFSPQAVFAAWFEAVRWSDDIIGRV